VYRIFEGYRVVEGAAFVAAPLCGMTLAQLGADVIRFDMIGGGLDFERFPVAKENGSSLYWAGLNKGKRSFAVDIRKPEGRELVTALVAQPGPGNGILSTNLAGVKWLDHAVLKERRADVVKLLLQGNHDGSTAVDYTVNCAVGYPYVTGSGDPGRPVNHVLPAWDVATGLMAALGLLAALEHRRRTGEGQEVKVSLSDVAMATVGNLGHIAEVQINDEERPAIGNYLYGGFGRDFATADGRRVMIAAVTKKQWQALVRATGIGEAVAAIERERGVDMRSEAGRYACREAIAGLVAPWCEARRFEAVREAFDREGVCWGPYQSFAEMVANDPRCSTANPMFQEIEQPGIGRYLAPGSPLAFAGCAREDVRPAPVLGEHTDAVLSEILGIGEREIGRLHDAGIVAGPDGR